MSATQPNSNTPGSPILLMASTDDKSPDGDDPLDSHSNNSLQSPVNIPPVGYSMHMYPFTSHLLPAQPLRSKRRQVKNACTNCQKACKKCDDARPCLRCVKYGISEECVDSQRKERKKGIKRGPYKKRDGKGVSLRLLFNCPLGEISWTILIFFEIA